MSKGLQLFEESNFPDQSDGDAVICQRNADLFQGDERLAAGAACFVNRPIGTVTYESNFLVVAGATLTVRSEEEERWSR